MIDPQEAVEAARANGEPQLAEWLQREVDAYHRETRWSRVKVGICVAIFWFTVAGLASWAWGAAQ